MGSRRVPIVSAIRNAAKALPSGSSLKPAQFVSSLRAANQVQPNIPQQLQSQPVSTFAQQPFVSQLPSFSSATNGSASEELTGFQAMRIPPDIAEQSLDDLLAKAPPNEGDPWLDFRPEHRRLVLRLGIHLRELVC